MALARGGTAVASGARFAVGAAARGSLGGGGGMRRAVRSGGGGGMRRAVRAVAVAPCAVPGCVAHLQNLPFDAAGLDRGTSGMPQLQNLPPSAARGAIGRFCRSRPG